MAKKQVVPQVMSLAQVKDCADYVESLKKYQHIRQQIEHNKDKLGILLSFKFDSKIPCDYMPPWRDTIQVNPASQSDLVKWMLAYYDGIIESYKNTIREFGVDPDKEDD